MSRSLDKNSLPALVVNDETLVRMAKAPPQEIFPIFRRNLAWTPWIVVLALLPGIFALRYRIQTEAGAAWGLYYYEILNSAGIDRFVDPVNDNRLFEPKWHAPLGAWLAAGMMRLTGRYGPLGIVLASYVATAAMIGVTFLMLKQLLSPSIAWWCTILLSCHTAILALSENPVPHAASIVFAEFAYWGFLIHLRRRDIPVSLEMLFGGISLGLCLLSGGPLAIVVVLTLLVHIFWLRGESVAPPKSTISNRPREISSLHAMKSLAVYALTAFAVGGWWMLMMYQRHGSEFLVNWATGAYRGTIEPATNDFLERTSGKAQPLFATLSLAGLMFGPMVLGMVYALREISQGTNLGLKSGLRFLFAWLGLAWLVWLATFRNRLAADEMMNLWQVYLLIPSLAFAAYGIDLVTKRRVSVGMLFLLITVSLALMIALRVAGKVGFGEPTSWNLWFPALYWLGAGLIWYWLWRFSRDHDLRQQIVLSGLLVGVVLAHCLVGLISIRRESAQVTVRDEYYSLQHLREELMANTKVEVSQIVLISPDDPPARLQFAVRTISPSASLQIYRSLDRALSERLAQPHEERTRTMFVDWSGGNDAVGTVPQRVIEAAPLISTQYFQRRPINVFILDPADDLPAPEETSSKEEASPVIAEKASGA